MKKWLLLILFMFTCFNTIQAHTINYSMEVLPATDVTGYYIKLGFLHILPYGYDHLLFILSLVLISKDLRSMLLQATCFTVAHTITLILTACNLIPALPSVVEPVIAASIAFMALQNLFPDKPHNSHYFIVFAFGLIHGLGFAGALAEIGLPRNTFYLSLFSFNAGVEIGQVVFILLIWIALRITFDHKQWYRKIIVHPLSVIIALVAVFWTIERL